MKHMQQVAFRCNEIMLAKSVSINSMYISELAQSLLAQLAEQWNIYDNVIKCLLCEQFNLKECKVFARFPWKL